MKQTDQTLISANLLQTGRPYVFVVCSFDETDLELDARLREVRQHGLAPNSALHIVRVRFNGPEEPGK